MASSPRIDELRKKFEENPRRYFAPLANEYRKAGDLQRAIELCREHLPQQPGHMSGHIVYGQALFEAGEFDQARQVFEEALRLDPENLIALRHLGDIARDHGDVATARDWYQRVLDADPRNEEIAAQIASLSAAPPAETDASAVPALDSDLIADIAAGVAEPPASGRAAGESTKAAAGSFLDEALGAAPREDVGHAPPPPDFAGSIDLPVADATTGAASAAGAHEDIALDFDALEGISSSTSPAPARPAGAADAEAPTTAAGRDASAIAELPTQEFAISEMAVETTARVDASGFGDIDLDAGAGAAGRDAGASSDLDEALAESGLAPTPASGVGAAAESSGGADFSDFALADAPVEDARPGASAAASRGEEAGAAQAPAAAAPTDAGEGYSLGRLSGLESMEFVPPDAAPADTAFDPTFGRTLREDEPAAASSATPAAFVTETMAELYLQQGFRDEALAVYRQLLAQQPGDANLRERVAQLEKGSVSTVSAADVSSSVIEAAQQRGAAQRGGRSMRAFLAGLAARRAPAGTYDRAATDTGRVAPADAGSEARASDDYVEAIGEGYDGRSGETVADSERATSTGRARFDEFGFPDVGPATPADAGRDDAAADANAEAPGAELPESAAIEPATLDYLAHEGASAAEAGVVPAMDAPDASAPPAPAGPVDTLFDGAAVSTNDEAAAATLADAFGAPVRAPTGGAARVPTPGRGALPARDVRTPATRPAAGELSLDDVFRETPRRSGSVRREGAPTFSFDQFFAEGAGTGGTGGASGPQTPAGSSNAASPSGAGDARPDDAPSSEADIEQFNAWLEGLKKK